ncbi:MAG TPA: hypothetical protein P5260_13660 [Candidatus Competibacter sp.]|jgi:hypothetical protein|nr:hypothetical protein [Candidatus Competibacter sp.]
MESLSLQQMTKPPFPNREKAVAESGWIFRTTGGATIATQIRRKSTSNSEQLVPRDGGEKAQIGGNDQCDYDNEREILKREHRFSPCDL